MALDASLRGNLSMDFFEAGHMMYTHLPSLEKVKGSIARFMDQSLPKQ